MERKHLAKFEKAVLSTHDYWNVDIYFPMLLRFSVWRKTIRFLACLFAIENGAVAVLLQVSWESGLIACPEIAAGCCRFTSSSAVVVATLFSSPLSLIAVAAPSANVNFVEKTHAWRGLRRLSLQCFISLSLPVLSINWITLHLPRGEAHHPTHAEVLPVVSPTP